MINENIPLNINFFQSANSAGKHIADDFVIRTKEYETIITEIRNYPMHDSVQHYLLLGRRGSGKSTLLKRIEYEINNDVALSKKLIPVNLAEEQANIYRLMDLWEEIIKELKHLGLNIDDSLLYEFTGDSNAYNRELYSIIHDALKKADKKIVLLLDNIDRIFENVKEDAALIREVLLNYDDIRIIGGSTRMSEHFWKYDLPFYNFFRVIILEALSNEEVKILLLHWAKTYNLPAIENFVKTKPGQLETIRILTDGLPRTLKFFINTIINRSQKDSYNYLKQIMDYVTPLYQERLNNLPAAHRKIVLNLAFIWEAASVKQLAEVCKIESKLLSAYLKQLYQNGIVDKVETNKKNHLYRIAERFFNLWLIFTQGSPSDKRKQKCLTIFLENWYDGNEIKEMALKHLQVLNKKITNADDVALFSKILAHSKYISTETRDNIIDKTLQLENLNTSLKESLPQKFVQIFNDVFKALEQKNWIKAIELTKNIEQNDGMKDILLGTIDEAQDKYKEAKKHYLNSIEKKQFSGYIYLAEIFAKQEDFVNSEKYYRVATEKNDWFSFQDVALQYQFMNKNELAEKYYLLSIKEGNTISLFGLASLYYYSAQNKDKSLELILQYNIRDRSILSKHLELFIKIWNGVFENLRIKVLEYFIEENQYKDRLILELLVHQQLELVNSFFFDKIIGQKLIEEFSPLYYTSQILLNQNKDENSLLKIPPEIKETVEELITYIQERQKLYYPE